MRAHRGLRVGMQVHECVCVRTYVFADVYIRTCLSTCIGAGIYGRVCKHRGTGVHLSLCVSTLGSVWGMSALHVGVWMSVCVCKRACMAARLVGVRECPCAPT